MDRAYPLSPMVMGKPRRHAKQSSMWVATRDLPRSAAHLPPSRYFRLPLIGYFAGLDAERAIACEPPTRCPARVLGLVLPEAPPDHSTSW